MQEVYSRLKGYERISELESDILPAKQFSSMETSAGRMVEEVVLPEYRWECVASEMHSINSALDGRTIEGDTYKIATLKSGPRCLNDEMSENFADAVLTNYQSWAHDADVDRLDFTYGVLYGTKNMSNKKDWHILRNIVEKSTGRIIVSPKGQWSCSFEENGIRVDTTIRIGLDWWNHLGGEYCFVEVFTALIRACVGASHSDPSDWAYSISDLSDVVSMDSVSEAYNVSLLQRSHIPWLFLMASHFCEVLSD